MIITIDGPAGSGKSSLSKKLARTLNFTYFNTGFMYRAITLYLMNNNIPFSDTSQIEQSLHQFQYEVIQGNHEITYLVNQVNVSKELLSPEVTQHVSEVAAIQCIRNFMTKLQRESGKSVKNAIFEGRDMGTIVFPNADIKFFITASPLKRAERRLREFNEKFPDQKHSFNLQKVKEDIEQRDESDSNRTLAPLKQAHDAIRIDTSNLTFKESEEMILNKIKKIIKST